MESLRNLPFVKLLVPLVSALLLAEYFTLAPWPFYYGILLLSLFILFFLHKSKIDRLTRISVKSMALFIHVLCLGFFISKYHLKTSPKPLDDQAYMLKILEPWTKQNNFYTCKAAIEGQENPSLAQVLIRLRSEKMPLGNMGDKIRTKIAFQGLSPPQNPMQFDYQKYLERKGIGYLLYLREGQYTLIKEKTITLTSYLEKSHSFLISTLDSSDLNPEANAFIKAILFGDKEDLDPGVKEAFSKAGASHVLAVSGLHVGIIVSLFSGLLKLLFGLMKKEKVKWLKALILLVIIWIYAGITGFSPSILRASIMFSFLVIGQNLTRHTNIYNSLAMAAFFMLIYNPHYLYDVGFQLSFIAVSGIVYLYPLLSKLFYFNYTFLQKIWKLCAVSIAAQLATFPIALYYFHQFPSYFLLTNLLVIPAAFVIVLLSILLLLFNGIKVLFHFLAILLNHVIELLNLAIVLIKKLPFSSIDELYIDSFQVFCILLFILFASLYFQYRKTRLLFLSLALAIGFFSDRLLHKIRHQTQNEVVIYAQAKHSAIDLIFHQKHYLLMDSILIKEAQKLSYAAENYHFFKDLSSISNTPKIVLHIDDIISNPYFIKRKQHIMLKKTLICLNHSSHEAALMQHFESILVFYDQARDSLQIDTAIASQFILNDWPAYANKRIQQDLLYQNSSKNYHSIAKDGYFHLELE